MTLDRACSGQEVTVLRMPAGEVHANLVRLGIEEGSELTCVLRMPAGPVVVRRGNFEVAVGKRTASQIEVALEEASAGGARPGWLRRLAPALGARR